MTVSSVKRGALKQTPWKKSQPPNHKKDIFEEKELLERTICKITIVLVLSVPTLGGVGILLNKSPFFANAF